VLAPALAANQFNWLPANGSELVLFDINAQAGIEPLLRWSPDEMVAALHQTAHATYTLSLVTNEYEASPVVVEHSWQSGQQISSETALGLQWPENVYSLTHVALPFPPGDPLYGGSPGQPSPGIELGRMAPRGERNVLRVSAAHMLRLRWNPFYPYLEQRIEQLIGFGSP
jgi:hypothetical protein